MNNDAKLTAICIISVFVLLIGSMLFTFMFDFPEPYGTIMYLTTVALAVFIVWHVPENEDENTK